MPIVSRMFLKGVPRLSLHLQLLHHRTRLSASLLGPIFRPWCTAAFKSARSDDSLSSANDTTAGLRRSLKKSPTLTKSVLDDPDYFRWKLQEYKILRDIDPIVLLTKDILHSDSEYKDSVNEFLVYRYKDGDCLTAEDETAVVKKLLSYHPHSEDKIGCRLDYIMVDRHPQFKHSRCLFVVRTDGSWIDFSYQKCLRTYIQQKYPSHAERFIREHLKRGNS